MPLRDYIGYLIPSFPTENPLFLGPSLWDQVRKGGLKPLATKCLGFRGGLDVDPKP